MDFKNMTKEDAITKYLEEISKTTSEKNISSHSFETIVLNSYKAKTNFAFSLEKVKLKKKYMLNILTLGCILTILFSYKNETSSLFLRTIQGYIYPSMKVVRYLALPLHKLNPELSEYYEETCLLYNPYFQLGDSDCQCRNKVNVLDLSDADGDDIIFEDLAYMPFFIKAKAAKITLHDLWNFYNADKDELASTPSQRKVFSTDSTIINDLDSLFKAFLNTTQPKESHNLWRCNRLKCAKHLRKIIKRPTNFPNAGFSVERFLLVDSQNSVTYRLPDTECSNVYLHQLVGSRKVLLLPTPECRKQCLKLTLTLPENHALFFNWWYYKPISISVENNLPSVGYVGSYC